LPLSLFSSRWWFADMASLQWDNLALPYAIQFILGQQSPFELIHVVNHGHCSSPV
jgi:hypothetical protein